ENIDDPYRHELASLFFLPLADMQYWPILIEMIVAHHRSIKDDARRQGVLDLDDDYDTQLVDIHLQDWEKWSLVALAILEKFQITIRTISRCEATEAFAYTVQYCRSTKLGWSCWKGLMISADHFASSLGEATFGALSNAFHIPNLANYHSQYRKNELFPLSLISAESERKHTLVSAPTGAGKTDFLLRRCQRRVFYTLPFQASINAMYERLKAEITDQKADIRLRS